MAHWREAAGELTFNPGHADLLIAPFRRSATENLATSTGLCQGYTLNDPPHCRRLGEMKGEEGEMLGFHCDVKRDYSVAPALELE